MKRAIIWSGVQGIGEIYLIRKRAKELISAICEEYGFEVEELEVSMDHVHIMLSIPLRSCKEITITTMLNNYIARAGIL